MYQGRPPDFWANIWVDGHLLQFVTYIINLINIQNNLAIWGRMEQDSKKNEYKSDIS